jgi:acyl carrier protein
MNRGLYSGCAEIFKEVSGFENSSIYFHWSDEQLLSEPFEKLGVDSLTLLEFVMKVESAYDVELNEEDVNRCKSVGDLVALVAAARNASN